MATMTMPQPRTAAAPKPRSTAKNPVDRGRKARSIDVLEFLAEAPRVDKEKGIVYGVRVLGRVSKNGHRYSDDAIRAGKTVYEDAVVNLDHPPDRNATAERHVRDRFGIIRNPVVKIAGSDDSDGVYAEHHFPLTHPYTPQYLEALERFPQTIGFSHNAVVTESVQDGKVIFNSIERVRSVDLVANPATTRGIFESESEGTLMGDENAIAADPNAAATTTDEAATDQTTDESIDEAFKKAINAILDDDELTVEQKKEKIVKLLDTHDEVTSGEKNDEEDEDEEKKSDDEKAADDAKKDDTASLRDRLNKLERKLKAKDALEAARDALESKGFRPSKVEVKAFSVLESEDERNEFIETLGKANKAAGGTANTAKPRSTSANALESASAKGGDGKQNSAVSLPKSHDELRALTYQMMRP